MKITTGLGAAPQAVALACLLPLLISSCAIPHSGKTAPRVQRGCIDLSGWDFENDGPVELDGEWEFYWKKFTRTGAASRREYGGKTEYLAVPGIWNGKVLHGRKLAGDGYATYRLRMLFNSRNPRGRKKLAVKVNDIATAYCLFVNGVRIAAGGSVGVSPALAEPGYRPDIAGFETEGGEADLVLHVSNFHHRKGGAWRSFTLGTERDIRERIEKNIMRDLFLFGSIFIMACYHLLLFSHRNREKSHCYFGLFCFLIALRILVTGEYYLAILAPAVAWEHVLRLEYLTVYLSVPVFFMFVQSLYRGEFKRRILYIAQGAGLIFAVTVIVTPSRVFTWTMQIYQFLTTLLCLYGLYALLRARARTREGSLTFLVGFIILFASVINDFMRSNHLVDTLYSVPLGLFIFIFSQSFLLARRFSRAFATLETLSEELEFKNTRLVEMDRLKNEFLAEVSHELRTPLNGMVGISESMLSQRFESMSISFRRNLALIAASGKRLAGLVDEILDLARLKNRDTVLNMRPVDIKTLADVVIILSRTVVGEKKVELVNSIAPWMPFACADENRVQQILINLVEYAVAFAEEGEVAISAELAVRGRDRSWMEIFVTAASGGVPADRNDAAQRSGYADEFNARINGDIGLSIARQLVELHGGSMRVESACAPGPAVPAPSEPSRPDRPRSACSTVCNSEILSCTRLGR